ncbi:MAG: helix-turn-helix transcriptional regulator [Candidatus Hodarchaeota archaeon]
MTNKFRNLSFPARERILYFLMQQGSLSDENADFTVKTIASSLNLSTNVVWNYLLTLEKEGFVLKKEKKGKSGRPAMVYSISEKGIELFPKTYMEFCITILDEIKVTYGEKGLQMLFSNIGKKLALDISDQMKGQLSDAVDSLEFKLNKLVGIFEEHGTFPKLDEDETTYTLTNYNCLMHGVAKVNPMICKVDETMINELIGQSVFREKCVGNGDGYCRFWIKKAEIA